MCCLGILSLQPLSGRVPQTAHEAGKDARHSGELRRAAS